MAVNQVDKMIEELEALSTIGQRRRRFFEMVASLPRTSQERVNLIARGRGAFAPGPYAHAEYLTLKPPQEEAKRVLSADEQERTRLHADALADLEAAKAAWEQAIVERDEAHRRPVSRDVAGMPIYTPAEEAEFAAHEEAVAEARAAYEDAAAVEVAARLHNQGRRRSRVGGFRFPAMGVIRRQSS